MKSNARFTTNFWRNCEQRLHICLRESPETHMDTLHLSCAVCFRSPQTVCTKYASGFLASGVVQYVVLRCIWVCVSSLLTTNHDTLSAFWRFLAKSLGLCTQFTYDEPRHALCLLEVPGEVSGRVCPLYLRRTTPSNVLSVSSWRLSRWVTHIRLQCRGKHASSESSGVSVADDASRICPCLSFRSFFASKVVTTPLYWQLPKVSWGFHNQKNVKIIVLNDFEVPFQHSSGRFQVK
jgi:hypothetical protein